VLLPRQILQATDFDASVESIERAAWATHRLALHFDRLMSMPGMLRPDGLLEHLSKSRGSGSLHDDDALSLAIMLFAAGYETSSSALSLAVRNLLLHRTTWQELLDAPELIPSAVEELLRFEGTIQARPHVALESVNVDDWHIQCGDRFQLLIGAANRDPNQFEHGDDLILDRSPNPHLAFFHGLHYCVGAPLARLTLQIGIEALLERLPDLQLVEGGEQWLPTYFAHSFERLLVTNAPS
jgi:pimeloyl-[acyl-carrier protein] synthase